VIRPLRRRHRAFVVALGLVVGPLFVAGLLARRPIPEGDLPAAMRDDLAGDVDPAAVQLHNTGGGLPLEIVPLAEPGGTMRRLRIALLTETRRPELLVYWQPGDDPEASIGEASRLLGVLVGTGPTFVELPESAQTEPGQLIFYSLTQHEVVDRVTPRIPAAAVQP